MSDKPEPKAKSPSSEGATGKTSPEAEATTKQAAKPRKTSKNGGAASASDTEGATPADSAAASGTTAKPAKKSRPKRSGIPTSEATSPDKFPRPPPRHSRIARSSQFLNPPSPDKMAAVTAASKKDKEQAARDSSTWPRKTKTRTPSLISPDTFPASTASSSKSPRPPRSSRSHHHDASGTSTPDSTNVKVLMEEMRQHVLQLKHELEQEKCFAKQLRREKTLEIRSVKESEQQRAVLSINELKMRYHQEKQKELSNLRDQLNKRHEEEIQRIQRQKEDQISKSQGELQKEHGSIIQRAKQEALLSARDEAKRAFENDKSKLQSEIEELKSQKRKLEDELHVVSKSDRMKANDLKRLVGEHQRAMDKIRKDARRDIVRLVS